MYLHYFDATFSLKPLKSTAAYSVIDVNIWLGKSTISSCKFAYYCGSKAMLYSYRNIYNDIVHMKHVISYMQYPVLSIVRKKEIMCVICISVLCIAFRCVVHWLSNRPLIVYKFMGCIVLLVTTCPNLHMITKWSDQIYLELLLCIEISMLKSGYFVLYIPIYWLTKKNCACGTVAAKIGDVLGLLVHDEIVYYEKTLNMANINIMERAQACSCTRKLQM